MNLFRYSGKKSPDKILAEICWWMKNVFEATEEEDEPEEGGRMDIERGPDNDDDDDNYHDIDIPYDEYGDNDL